MPSPFIKGTSPERRDGDVGPPALAGLALLYTLASLAHFSHNAEYIAFYPGLPAWVTRESVYLAWLGVVFVGVLALVAWQAGYRRTSAGLLVGYGMLGTDGLLHYTLALCSEHTLVTNVTIWGEAVTGVVLAGAGCKFLQDARRGARCQPYPQR